MALDRTLDRLQRLAREAVYEPGRGEVEEVGPEPVRGEAREMRARLNGDRLFYATDERGELCAFGVMEPGGMIVNVEIGLLARMERVQCREPKLRAV